MPDFLFVSKLTVTALSAADAQDLIDFLAPHAGILVAFSGGVDSSVVAAAAHRAAGDRCLAVTANSPSVAQWQIEMAKRVAAEIGMGHCLVETKEWQREDYVRNDSDRCFYCKSTLYDSIEVIQQQSYASDWVLVSGTNADDLGDHRPGLRAGELAAVMTPLADLGWGKNQVREIAHHWGLSNADLPASPCLASRIAYGVSVTPARLQKVESAEKILRNLGFKILRVRLHSNEIPGVAGLEHGVAGLEHDVAGLEHDVAGLEHDVASLEVEPDRISELERLFKTTDLDDRFRAVGFAESTVDPEGFRSGKLNDVLAGSHPPPPSLYRPTLYQLDEGNA